MNSVTVHSSQPSFTASHFRCWLWKWLKSTFYHFWKVSNLNNLFHYVILFCRLIYINAGNSICRFAFSSFFPLLLIQNLWHLHKHNSLYRIFHLCVQLCQIHRSRSIALAVKMLLLLYFTFTKSQVYGSHTSTLNTHWMSDMIGYPVPSWPWIIYMNFHYYSFVLIVRDSPLLIENEWMAVSWWLPLICICSPLCFVLLGVFVLER